MEDIRDILFSQVSRSRITACIFSDDDGVLSGVERAAAKAAELGLTVNYAACEGAALMAGDLVMELCGPPKAIAKAEDNLMGLMLKPSGIATAAARFVRAAGDMRIVCGSWKKLPREIKPLIRDAVTAGGAGVRICEEPMVYLDKNYVEMLGGIQSSLRAAEQLGDRKKVIQIRGKYENGDIVREAFSAVSAGADIVFVDTGRLSDIRKVCEVLLPALRSWKEEFGYRDVKLAYAGGVSFEQLEELRGLGVDIVGVGRAIIDAPLLDMHMDVVKVESDEDHRHKYDLLDKSELLIQGIRLERGNLNVISDIVAEELGIDPDDVLVIDVRDSSVALDILQKQLDPKVFIGKERAILDRLSRTDGVFISDETRISSRGMLGWIVADEEETTEMFSGLERGQQNTEKITEIIKKRAIVFPSGTEVEDGEIEDTNTPLLISKLTEAGFTAEAGPVLKDDLDLFAGKLRRAMDGGYGVLITTGGVGAENKDFSVEAILRLDPAAAAPYIAKFKVGEGRHRKEGIRIAVGQVGFTTLVALPGPNDEVALCADCLIEGITKGWSKEVLAGRLAKLLRARLTEKMAGHHGHGN